MDAPKYVRQIIEEEIPKAETPEEANRLLWKLAGPKYRHQFKIQQYWLGDKQKLGVNFVGADHFDTPYSRVRERTHKKWKSGTNWIEFATMRGVPHEVLKRWDQDWTKRQFPIMAEEREKREREKQLQEEAHWMALTMKMNEITAVIEKLLDKVEAAAGTMEVDGFSPRDLKDLVGACEALQKMRNLEEGRPTSLSGKSNLSRSTIVDRLMKLKDKGIPIEVDPRIFSFSNKNVQ